MRKRLRMWADAADCRAARPNDRQAIRSLMESIEHAALRLGAVERAWRAHIADVPQRLGVPLDSLYGTCVTSLQSIEQALGDKRTVPDLPDVSEPLRALQVAGREEGFTASTARALGLAAHLQSLANAIHVCRDRFNSIDWEAWNRNRF